MGNAPVEKKVVTTTVTAAVTSLVVGYLTTKFPNLVDYNEYLAVIVTGVITAGLTYVVGFWTKHTARNDAQTRKDRVSDPIPPTDTLNR